jgi:hypothetical protein
MNGQDQIWLYKNLSMKINTRSNGNSMKDKLELLSENFLAGLTLNITES